jgi:hypothetical protein
VFHTKLHNIECRGRKDLIEFLLSNFSTKKIPPRNVGTNPGGIIEKT